MNVTGITPNEVPEVIEVSDAEAAKLIQLKDYGVTSDITEENLALLYSLYLEHLKTVQAHSENQKKGATSQNELRTQAQAQIQKIEKAPEVDEIISQILDLTFGYLDVHPEQAYHFSTGLSGVLNYVNDITKTSVEKISYGLKQDQGIDVTLPDEDDSVEDSKNLCKAVRFTLTNLLNVAPLIGVAIPDSIKVKTGKNGNLLPDLPDLPKGRTAGSNLGRGAKARKVKYFWKPANSSEFVALRDGVLLAELATSVVSKGKFRISSQELQNKFGTGEGKTNQFSEEPWEINFPTGTLKGFLPKEGA